MTLFHAKGCDFRHLRTTRADAISDEGVAFLADALPNSTEGVAFSVAFQAKGMHFRPQTAPGCRSLMGQDKEAPETLPLNGRRISAQAFFGRTKTSLQHPPPMQHPPSDVWALQRHALYRSELPQIQDPPRRQCKIHWRQISRRLRFNTRLRINTRLRFNTRLPFNTRLR